MGKENEYKEIFLAEAQEGHEELNNLFTELEKDINSKSAINSIFRITHTLKGNAMGMGFTEIAELSHVMEDVFNEVKSSRLHLDSAIFSSLFKANDILGQLINSLNTGEVVKYKGIKTKLEVLLKNAKASEIVSEDTVKVVETTLTETITQVSQTEITTTNTVLETIEDTDEDDSIEQKIVLSDVVQVPVRKLDALLNIIGELIIEKDTLVALNIERGYQSTDLARLHRITSDLQYGVMDVRLVQIGFLFNKFHRVLRDVAVIENKKVDLVLEGTEIEIDRNILKIMSDSLVHLVRNSVSHGIESPQKRLERGKPETGKVTLRASNEKDTVFIEVRDDGNGIDLNVIKRKAVEKGLISADYAKVISDDEIMMLLFEPGFSNAEKITEVSGRGVGMDVVRGSVESIGGKITIETELGKGSVFTLSLPSSMAVKGALLFELNNQSFAIALTHTEAVISLRKEDIHKISTGLISKYLGKTISIVFLNDLFRMRNMHQTVEEGAFHKTFENIKEDQKLDVVIVAYNKHLVGFVVDKLMQQKEIVEKALESPVQNVELFSGATILGDGNICLVLDVAGILKNLFKEKMNAKIEI
ncbi:MAG: chemotaxis protein CheA [Sphingobacteriaceae bacterium]|nr:chemotaxis protein CheA [Sphingobacteriaceae bacterium]